MIITQGERLMEIREITEVTPALIEAFQRLMPQLSSSAVVPGEKELQEMVSAPGTVLFIAEKEDQIIGSLTLVMFRIPTGVRAWIEDVVVDQEIRRSGAGRALCQAAIEKARAVGARTIDLSSRPEREAADQLYQKLGFQKRNTGVYRFSIEQ